MAGVSGAADFARGGGFFVITTAINSMINEATAASGTRGEEADAGAGRQPNSSSEAKSQFQDTCRTEDPENCRTLETVDQSNDWSMNPDSVGDSNNLLIPSRHRAAILDMLAG
jgi:hypothetical protein